MSLTVLQYRHESSPADLLRLFHQTDARWAEHLAEGEDIDIGTAYANASLPEVFDANNIRDVALPEGMSPEEAVRLVTEHYVGRSSRCAYWTMNPSAPELRTQPLVQHLLGLGYTAQGADVMVLRRLPAAAPADSGGLTIIPARASFRHARALFEESARRWGSPQIVEADMLHLDDPHWDALLALKDGHAVAHAGVLSMGEVGRIDLLYVAEAHRRAGYGRILMNRVLEICARSLFRHVMLAVLPENRPAINLYESLGFQKIGQITGYYAGAPPR